MNFEQFTQTYCTTYQVSNLRSYGSFTQANPLDNVSIPDNTHIVPSSSDFQQIVEKST